MYAKTYVRGRDESGTQEAVLDGSLMGLEPRAALLT